MVDLEVIAARGDMSKLLGQFGALLAAFSFLLAGTVRGYAESPLPAHEVLIQAWAAEHFLIATTMLVVTIRGSGLGFDIPGSPRRPRPRSATGERARCSSPRLRHWRLL